MNAIAQGWRTFVGAYAPMALDADRWVTVHPNGPQHEGSPVKLGEGGEVKAGMGGKFTGENIAHVKGARASTGRTAHVASSAPATGREAVDAIAGDYADHGYGSYSNVKHQQIAENIRKASMGDLSYDEMDALGSYSDPDDYKLMNKALRSGAELTGRIGKAINDLSAAAQKSALSENTVLYRGVSGSLLQKSKELFEPGSTFTDKAFQSTTIDGSIAENFAMKNNGYIVKIFAPKGTKLIPMNGMSQCPAECEMTLDRGASLHVMHVDHDERTVYAKVAT